MLKFSVGGSKSCVTIIVIAALLATLAVAGIALRAQQDKHPAQPRHQSRVQIDSKTVTVDYSSPRAKGARFLAASFPTASLGAGANEATTLVTSGDINIGGKTVPAGNTLSSPFQPKTNGLSHQQKNR